MGFKISGQVVMVQPLQQPTEKFRYQNLILCLDGTFPQEVCIQFQQQFTDLLTGITPKAEVTVTFELRGRRDSTKEVWYTTIVGYDINKN